MPQNKNSSKDGFSETEVGALVESLRSEIRVVAEGVASVQSEVAGLKVWREETSQDISLLKAGLRNLKGDLNAFDARLKTVEDAS